MSRSKLFLIIMFLVAFGTAGLTQAEAGVTQSEEISFIRYIPDGEALQGVNPDTSLWSTNDSVVNLGVSSWSLLDGSAWVRGYNGDDEGILTHRGTRGLGIFGRETDEIDSYNHIESIEIAFNQPQYLNSLEVRSLFVESIVEQGAVAFYMNDSNFYTQHMQGIETIGGGSKGIASFVYDDPYVVDKLVFYVPQCKSYTSESEFAIAKLNVTATPEPVSSTLFLIGGGALAVARLRKKYSSC